VREHVSVDIHGCVDARVPKNLLQDLESTGDLAPNFGFWDHFVQPGFLKALHQKPSQTKRRAPEPKSCRPETLQITGLNQKPARGKGPGQRIALALFAILAPKEGDTDTSPQGNRPAQLRHLPHLLQDNIRVPSYGMSMAPVRVQRIVQRTESHVGL
jgi:hypothetical protein